MHVFYTFLIEQLIPIPYQLELSEEYLSVNVNGNIHTEALFYGNFYFTDEEIIDLYKITKEVLSGEETRISDDRFPFLKIWFLTTHEFYFKNDLTPDKYGRIGFENLREEFKEILKVPIADVIKKIIQTKLGIRQEINATVYLTCDFDILNIWDAWGIKDLAREVFQSSIKGQFRKGYETIGSYFFSRFIPRFNGYLNERMYCYEEGFVNQGFFIATMANRQYDGFINYKNKIVDRYITKLRSKKVHLGLHTNFETMNDPLSIHKQQADFEGLFGSKALINRHHYLRLRNPDYLKTLELGGIKEDYSLYFPESMIFRAGTSSKFQVWNFEENRPYEVSVIPTTIMDGTFSDYMYSSYEEAYRLSIEKIKLALRFGGNVVLLWHNRSTYQYANIENNFHPQLIDTLIEFLKSEGMTSK